MSYYSILLRLHLPSFPHKLYVYDRAHMENCRTRRLVTQQKTECFRLNPAKAPFFSHFGRNFADRLSYRRYLLLSFRPACSQVIWFFNPHQKAVYSEIIKWYTTNMNIYLWGGKQADGKLKLRCTWYSLDILYGIKGIYLWARRKGDISKPFSC